MKKTTKRMLKLSGLLLFLVSLTFILRASNIKQNTYRLIINNVPSQMAPLYDRKGNQVKDTIKSATIINKARLTLIQNQPYYKVKPNRFLPEGYAQLAVDQGGKTINQEAQLIASTNFNGVILLADNGNITSLQAYGYANPVTKQKNTTTTLFPTASLQKVMTAAMVMQLIAQKKLSFDSKLSRFIPLIPKGDTITVRQLLDHRSGISMGEETPEKVLKTREEILDFYLAHMAVNDTKEYEYTNLNYVLLAMIISKVTGKSYTENLKARIIQPLKLTHTYTWQELPKDVPVATGFSTVDADPGYETVKVPDTLLSSLLGAGNLYMDVPDMFTFQQALNNGQVLTQPEYEALSINQGSNDYYGGMVHLDTGMRLVQGSFDDFPNTFATISYMEEAAQSGVIAFANNSTDVDLANLADQLYNLTN